MNTAAAEPSPRNLEKPAGLSKWRLHPMRSIVGAQTPVACPIGIRHCVALATLLLCVSAAPLQANPDFIAARGLYEQHHFRDAEASLRDLVKAEPANGVACHYLARAILARVSVEKPEKGETELRTKEAAQWLARASELEPKNAAYLRDCGMSQITGVGSVKKGRKVLEEALVLDPKDAETHYLLSMLYSVPWVLGSDKDKADQHGKAVQELAPVQFAINETNRLIWNEKDFPRAFAYTEALWKKDPASALGHYLYAYVASEAKTNLEAGMVHLKQALELPLLVSPRSSSPFTPPFSATPSYYWETIGKIERARGNRDAACKAFATAVELDPANHWAAESLAKLKP